jgi:putative endonuclease
MSVVVYVLFSERTQRYYTGQSQDLQNRLSEHNAGETPSIKKGIPWKLVWNKECESRSEALKLENKIKKRGAKRFLDDLSRGT